MNKHMLIGYVGKDPEIRNFPDGGILATFSVATSFRYKNKQGERCEQTDWHNVVASGSLATSVVSPYVKKGSRIYLSGRSVTRKWQDKDGADKYTTEIKLDEIELLSNNEKDDSQPAQQSRPAARPAPSRAGAGMAVPKPGIDEEDIPFAPMNWKGLA